MYFQLFCNIKKGRKKRGKEEKRKERKEERKKRGKRKERKEERKERKTREAMSTSSPRSRVSHPREVLRSLLWLCVRHARTRREDGDGVVIVERGDVRIDDILDPVVLHD